MSSVKKVLKSSRRGSKRRLVLLVLLALLSACAPASPAAPAATPTGPLIPKDQAIQMGLGICNSGRITSAVEPELDAAELTTNQAIAAQLGRPSWAELPPDSPIWLVKYRGAFSIAQPPATRGPSTGNGTPAPVLSSFPACWAIIEARFGARGTVYLPQDTTGLPNP
jgi:hypothetical protein